MVRATLVGFALIALGSPAFAHDPCIGIQREVIAASWGMTDPDPAVKAAWARDGRQAVYQDAVSRLDACHQALQAMPPRTVGSGARQTPPGINAQ